MSSDHPDYPPVPKEAIIKPEDERPSKLYVKPEEAESDDEREYEQMKSADNDMDGDDNPDFDPSV